mgnify:CR=1 FL=1
MRAHRSRSELPRVVPPRFMPMPRRVRGPRQPTGHAAGGSPLMAMRPHLAANLIVTLTVLGWLVHLALSAPAAITLRTSPRAFGVAPCPVTVWVRAVPVETDRAIHVALDGPLFYRSSSWAIEGTTAPPIHEVRWRDVPAGTYDITATIGNARVRARAVQTLQIFGP